MTNNFYQLVPMLLLFLMKFTNYRQKDLIIVVQIPIK